MQFTVRNIAAFFYANYLLYTGKIKKYKINANQYKIITSVYFHNPSKKQFEKCVLWFLKHKFTFISTEDLYNIISFKKDWPSSAVIFTIDDGWRENKDNVVAIATKYNIPITIFIVSDLIKSHQRYWWSYFNSSKKYLDHNLSLNTLKIFDNDKRLEIIEEAKKYSIHYRESMNLNEISEIIKNKNVTIGSHTVSHPILTKCNDTESEREILFSKKEIENLFNHPIFYFAYPNGEYTNREKEYLKKSNYKLAFTTSPKYILADSLPNIYEIPRFDVLENVSFSENICRMTGIWFNQF